MNPSEPQIVLDMQLFPSYENMPRSKCFSFHPIEKELRFGKVLKVGRKIDRKDHVKPTTREERAANNVSVDKECMMGGLSEADDEKTEYLAFRSKVVSRLHAEIWMDRDGQVAFIKASCTFGMLARLRESRPYPLKSGDIIQFGVDYQGRQEEIYKAVAIKIFISVKTGKPSRLNSQKLKGAIKGLLSAMNPNSDGDPATDCCICLHSMAPYQALFLGPCSHCFHYKCVVPIIQHGFSMFQCPLCRQVANLEATVTVDDENDELIEEGEVDMASSPPLVMVDGAKTLARRPFGGRALVSNPSLNQINQSDEASLSTSPEMSDERLNTLASMDVETPNDPTHLLTQLSTVFDALLKHDRPALTSALDTYDGMMKSLFDEATQMNLDETELQELQHRLCSSLSLNMP